jgi:hypothetical protein
VSLTGIMDNPIMYRSLEGLGKTLSDPRVHAKEVNANVAADLEIAHPPR